MIERERERLENDIDVFTKWFAVAVLVKQAKLTPPNNVSAPPRFGIDISAILHT